jgi:hypothetical protein
MDFAPYFQATPLTLQTQVNRPPYTWDGEQHLPAWQPPLRATAARAEVDTGPGERVAVASEVRSTSVTASPKSVGKVRDVKGTMPDATSLNQPLGTDPDASEIGGFKLR